MAEDALSPAEPDRPATAEPSPSTAPSSCSSSAGVSPSPRTSGSEAGEAATPAVGGGEHRAEPEAKSKGPGKAKASGDGKKKRKRTSAKDWAFLWAFFKQNPRPNAAQRAEIANHVDMDTEGVRIWFQNRRSERARKCSRELSVEELQAYQMGKYGDPNQSALAESLVGNASSSSDYTNPSPPHAPGPAQNLSPPDRAAACASCSAPTSPSSQAHPQPHQPLFPQRSNEPRPLLSRSFSGPTGYLSNRWNTAGAYSTGPQPDRPDSFRAEPYPSSCPPSLPGASGPSFAPSESQSAKFRLSLSMEGKAVVVPSVPSPPRRSAPPQPPVDVPAPRPRALPGFHELAESVAPKNSGPLPPRLTRGRSRDVNAWEYCCDSKIREDPLTAQARHESSGSATAAISLLRSTSSTAAAAGGGVALTALQPSASAKRNVAASRGRSRPATHAKRPRLSRAASSAARLDTAAADHFWAADKPAAGGGPYPDHLDLNSNLNLNRNANSKPKLGTSASFTALVPGNDSDKENWSPDEDGNPRRPVLVRPTPVSSASSATGSSARRRPLPLSRPVLDGSGGGKPGKTGSSNPRRSNAAATQHSSRPRTLLLHGRAHTAPAAAFALGSPRLLAGYSHQSQSRSHGRGYRRGRQGRGGRAASPPVEIFEDEDDDAAVEGQEEEEENENEDDGDGDGDGGYGYPYDDGYDGYDDDDDDGDDGDKDEGQGEDEGDDEDGYGENDGRAAAVAKRRNGFAPRLAGDGAGITGCCSGGSSPAKGDINVAKTLVELSQSAWR